MLHNSRPKRARSLSPSLSATTTSPSLTLPAHAKASGPKGTILLIVRSRVFLQTAPFTVDADRAFARACLLVTQSFDRFKTGCEVRRDQRSKRTDKKSTNANDGDVPRNDFG